MRLGPYNDVFQYLTRPTSVHLLSNNAKENFFYVETSQMEDHVVKFVFCLPQNFFTYLINGFITTNNLRRHSSFVQHFFNIQ